MKDFYGIGKRVAGLPYDGFVSPPMMTAEESQLRHGAMSDSVNHRDYTVYLDAVN